MELVAGDSTPRSIPDPMSCVDDEFAGAWSVQGQWIEVVFHTSWKLCTPSPGKRGFGAGYRPLIECPDDFFET